MIQLIALCLGALIAGLVLFFLLRAAARKKFTNNALEEAGFTLPVEFDLWTPPPPQPLMSVVSMIQGSIDNPKGATISVAGCETDLYSLDSDTIRFEVRTDWLKLPWGAPRDERWMNIYLCQSSDDEDIAYAKKTLASIVNLHTQDKELPLELLTQSPFTTRSDAFNEFFPLRYGNYHVHCAAEAVDLDHILDPLLKWSHLFSYVMLVSDKRANPKIFVDIPRNRIASYKTFLDTLPGINADIISFGNRLARALLAYEIPQNHLVSASINVGFSMIANCKCCGGSVPLTGPRESYSCPTCSNIVTISRENWRTILRRPLEQHEMTHENMVNNNAIFFLTSEVQSELRECEWNLVAPRCLHCDQGLEEQAVGKIPAGTNERIPCPLCGKENVALPPPRWVKDLVPAIGILVNAQTDTQGEAPPLTEPDDIKPIIFSCPQCAANLSITRDRERTLTCTYCNASVYLPDGLWFKLHPPKTRRIWTARYDYRLPPATGT